jgi:glucose/arabinose dehydrogenase
MPTAALASFVIVYTATVAVAITLRMGLRKDRQVWPIAGLAFVVFLEAVAAASLALPGRNSLLFVFPGMASADRTRLVMTCAAFLFGLLASTALSGTAAGRMRTAAALIYLGTVLSFSVLSVKRAVTSPLPAPEQGIITLVSAAASAPVGLRIEEIAQLTIAPTSLALDGKGRLHVAGYQGRAYQRGTVIRLDESGGRFNEVRVADYVNRPHGIAFRGGDLYLSHSGQHTHARGGRIIQENTGLVTRLQDLDGDGRFDYYDDVITGLPGAQLPDGLHQNNGIAFDSQDWLYVTVGAPSDRGPVVHPYAGTILRVRPDGSELSVFARGFRNPYDLALDRQNRLYCTDNDSEQMNPGDALFRVEEGGHYGHPYSAAGDDLAVSGIRKCLLRTPGALEGLVYAPAGSLQPGYDDCLYVASFNEGRIYQARVAGDGRTASLTPFASVPGVLDIVISPQGVIYACSHVERKIYRICKG